jgi:hypothetical protein
LPADGPRPLAQKVAVVSRPDLPARINEGSYGPFSEELRLSILRSPAYSADPAAVGPLIPQDRYVARQDQGERIFRFWFDGGRRAERLTAVDREALAKNEKPFALAFFPSGQGKRPLPFIELSDDAVQVAAMKKAEDGRGLIIRLFEPTGQKRKTVLSLPWAKARKTAPCPRSRSDTRPAAPDVRSSRPSERPAGRRNEAAIRPKPWKARFHRSPGSRNGAAYPRRSRGRDRGECRSPGRST